MATTGLQDLLAAGGAASSGATGASASAGKRSLATVNTGDFLQSLSNAVRSLGTRGSGQSGAESGYGRNDDKLGSAYAARPQRSGSASAAANSASSNRAATAGREAQTFGNASSYRAAARSDERSSNAALNRATPTDTANASATASSADADGNAAVEQNDAGREPTELDYVLAMLPFVQTTDPLGQEALNRIAGLTADGVIDPEVLSGLSNDQISELADWALAGAGGLFAAFDPAATPGDTTGAASLLAGDTARPLADFGFGMATQAMTQLQQLQQALAGDATAAGATDATGAPSALSALLSDLGGTGALSQDALAQIADSLRAALQAGQPATNDLAASSLVQSLSGDELAALLNSSLEQSGASALPALPEAVVRSLGVTLLSYSEEPVVEADASDLTRLYSGLTGSNAGLREALLAQSQIAATGNNEPAALQPDLDAATAPTDAEQTAPGAQLAADAALEGAPDLLPAAGTTAGSLKHGVLAQAPETGQATTAQTASAQAQPAAASATAELLSQPANAGAAGDATDAQAAAALPDFADGSAQQDGEGEPSLRDQAALLQAVRASATESAEVSSSGFTATLKASMFQQAADELPGLAPQNAAGVAGAGAASATNVPTSEQHQSADATLRYAQMSENIDRLQKLMQSATSGSGLKSLTMQLTPDELGKIAIRIELRDGAVHATIKTENDAARDMLLSGSDQLRKTLEASGVKLDSFDVSVNRDGYEEPDGRNQAGWQAAQDERNKQQNGATGHGRNANSNGTTDDEASAPAIDGSVLPGGSLNVVA